MKYDFKKRVLEIYSGRQPCWMKEDSKKEIDKKTKGVEKMFEPRYVFRKLKP